MRKDLINEIKRYYEVIELYNNLSINAFKLSKYGIAVDSIEKECLKGKSAFMDNHFKFMITITKDDILSLGKDIKQIPIGWLFDYAKVTGVFEEDEVISLYKNI